MKLTHKDMPDGYHGYVYTITNLLDGRNYVGQHRLRRIDEPFMHYMGSSKELTRDIFELKVENFEKEIIEFAKTGSDLVSLETKHILLFKAQGKAEYNKAIWSGSIICIYCNDSFTNASSLRKHQSKNHNILDNENCRFCSESIARGGGMAAHIRGKHSDEMGLIPETCSICGEQSFLNGFQAWHFNENHAEKLECSNCDQTFVKMRFFLKHQENSPCSRGELLCDCGNAKMRRSEICSTCEQNRRKILPVRLDKEKLLADLARLNGNFAKLSLEYEVSDNAIRKWLKKFDLPISSKHYKKL